MQKQQSLNQTIKQDNFLLQLKANSEILRVSSPGLDFCLFPVRVTQDIFSIKQFDTHKKPRVHDLVST